MINFRGLNQHITARSAARCLLAFVFVLVLIHSQRLFAQADQGTVTGVVQDTSGAVVSGAEVTLANTDTGLALHAKTNSSGIYTFSPVKIGHYTVSAAASGFETTLQENLNVDIQERLNVALTLKPGRVSQTVTVSTAPPLLQTGSGSVGQVMTTETINNTPLAQRNWVYLAQFSAGVVPSNGTRGGASGDYEANGQIAEQNNFILDGVDNNVNIIDYMNGSTYGIVPPPDAVSQFNLETADFSAEFGHSAGSVLNVSIKSGTNHIHGDVWEYVRNTALDAENWNALVNPPYHMNQFGGTLGLPILRNRLFYFGDIQNTRLVYSGNNTYTVPTMLMRQGNFSELLSPALTGNSKATCLFQPNSGGAGASTGAGCTGNNLLVYNGQQNVFAPSQISAVAQNILSLYPQPNANGGKTYNNLIENQATRNMTAQWDQRLDWNITGQDQSYARYSYNHVYNTLTPPLGDILDGTGNYAGSSESYITQNFMLSETHIFDPNLINEFRFGYNWGNYQNLQPNYNTNEAAKLGLGNMPFGSGYFKNGGLPSVSVSGVQAFGSHGNDPSVEGQNIYQILDNVSKIIGNHSLKFGVALQNFRILFLQPPTPRGAYSYSGTYTSTPGVANTGFGVADFLADQMNGANITNEPIFNMEWRYDSGYVEDHWKVTSRLTLNYGVRYDYFQPYRELANQMGNFVPSSWGVGTGTGVYRLPAADRSIQLNPTYLADLAADQITLQYDSDPRLSTGQKTNFAPRLGVAYQIDPKTVIRAGYGIFYGALQSAGSNPDLTLNYPFLDHPSLTSVGCTGGKHCPSLGPDKNGNPGQAQNYNGDPNATLENGLAGPLAQGLSNFVSFPVIQGRDLQIHTPYTESYNLTVQHAFGNNVSATIGYVGNVGRHLETLISANPTMALLHPGLSTTNFNAFPFFGGNPLTTYEAESSYNGLQTKLERRYSNGMSYLATYTWSHALQDSVDPLGGGITYRDTGLIPIRDEYSQSNYDVRNRFTFVGQYELPFGHGRRFMNHSTVEDLIAGGWRGSLTFTAQSGIPFTVGDSNISTAAGGTARAIKVRNPFAGGGSPDPSNPSVTCPAHVHNKTNWYNPCAFANPLSGNNIPSTGSTLATATYLTGEANAIAYLGGRSNVVTGPGYERINMSLFKSFSTWREQSLQFRADVFNLFNHPSWTNPSNTGNSNTGGLITGFWSLQSNTPDARFFQLSAKYIF
jgi:hypothetical protein